MKTPVYNRRPIRHRTVSSNCTFDTFIQSAVIEALNTVYWIVVTCVSVCIGVVGVLVASFTTVITVLDQ